MLEEVSIQNNSLRETLREVCDDFLRCVDIESPAAGKSHDGNILHIWCRMTDYLCSRGYPVERARKDAKILLEGIPISSFGNYPIMRV